jgi:hypothetical protein
MALQPNSGPGLPFWGFLTITFLLVQRPTPKIEYEVSIFMTPGDRHCVPILVAFYDVDRLQWDYSLIPATTWEQFSKYLVKISTEYWEYIAIS